MSIPSLQRLATLPRPLILTDPHQIDELVVLRKAGRVAGRQALSTLSPRVERVG